MVASLRPPSLRRPSEGEVKSSQVADSREEEKRHHHAMPKDGRTEGRADGHRWHGQAEPSHVMQKGWLAGRRGEGRPVGRTDGPTVRVKSLVFHR